MKYGILSEGVGNPVGWECVADDVNDPRHAFYTPVQPGENDVLAVDGVTLRARTTAESDAVAEALRIEGIKLKARQHILAVLPEWKQNNLNARFAELTEKRVDGNTLSAAEAAEVVSMKALWSWVKTVRTESDAAEAGTASADAVAFTAWAG